MRKPTSPLDKTAVPPHRPHLAHGRRRAGAAAGRRGRRHRRPRRVPVVPDPRRRLGARARGHRHHARAQRLRRRPPARLVLLSTTMVYGAHPLNPNFLSEEHELTRPRPARASSPTRSRAEHQVRALRRASTPTTAVAMLRFAPLARAHRRQLRHPLLLAPDRAGAHGLRPADAVRARARRRRRPQAGGRPRRRRRLQHRRRRACCPTPRCSRSWAGCRCRCRTSWPRPLSRRCGPPRSSTRRRNFLDFLRFLCVADGGRARAELGFRPGSTSSAPSSTSWASAAEDVGRHRPGPGLSAS